MKDSENIDVYYVSVPLHAVPPSYGFRFFPDDRASSYFRVGNPDGNGAVVCISDTDGDCVPGDPDGIVYVGMFGEAYESDFRKSSRRWVESGRES